MFMYLVKRVVSSLMKYKWQLLETAKLVLFVVPCNLEGSDDVNLSILGYDNKTKNTFF